MVLSPGLGGVGDCIGEEPRAQSRSYAVFLQPRLSVSSWAHTHSVQCLMHLEMTVMVNFVSMWLEHGTQGWSDTNVYVTVKAFCRQNEHFNE
jgi:hypothetical protein